MPQVLSAWLTKKTNSTAGYQTLRALKHLLFNVAKRAHFFKAVRAENLACRCALCLPACAHLSPILPVSLPL